MTGTAAPRKRGGAHPSQRSPAAAGLLHFLIGIERAWELVGGPSVTLHHEFFARVQDRRREASRPDDTDSS